MKCIYIGRSSFKDDTGHVVRPFQPFEATKRFLDSRSRDRHLYTAEDFSRLVRVTPERSLKRMATNAGIETHLPKSKLIDRLIGLLAIEPEEAAAVDSEDGGEGVEAVSEEGGELLDFEAFDGLKLSEKKEALKDLGLLDEADDLRSGDSMSLVYADHLESQ